MATLGVTGLRAEIKDYDQSNGLIGGKTLLTSLTYTTGHTPITSLPWDGKFAEINLNPLVNPDHGVYYWTVGASFDGSGFFGIGGININIGGQNDSLAGIDIATGFHHFSCAISVRIIRGKIYWLISIIDSQGFICGCWLKICGFSPFGAYTLITTDAPAGTTIPDWWEFNPLSNSLPGTTYYMHPSTVNQSGRVPINISDQIQRLVLVPYIAPPPVDPLLGTYRWKGNGNVNDDVDSNNGIKEGSLTYAAGLNSGQCFKGDGSSAYIATTRELNWTTIYSVSAWFNTTSAAGFAIICFDSAQTGITSATDKILLLNSAGKIVLAPYAGTGIISPLAYNDGNWHYVVATNDGTTQTLYVDGDGIAAVAYNGQQHPSVGWWKIGILNNAWGLGTTSQYFNGLLQDVRYYDHVLSAANILYLWPLGPSV